MTLQRLEHEPLSDLLPRARQCLANTLDWLLPRYCLMCGDPSGDMNLCLPCQADLPRTGPCCRRCGLKLKGEHDGVCAPCLLHPPLWERVLPALEYAFPVDVLVQKFKFNRSLACGEVLAQAMLRAVDCAEAPSSSTGLQGPADADCIVPVPLHRSRLAVRGFNQSEVVARYVARRTGIPFNGRLLSRVRRTAAQSDLDGKARRRNTRGAFHCNTERAHGIRHAILLDDVMTTGATLEACTLELKRVGIATVTLWVVARAPPPGR